MTRLPSASSATSPMKVVVALLLAVAAGLYASGYFFLWAIHAKRKWKTCRQKSGVS